MKKLLWLSLVSIIFMNLTSNSLLAQDKLKGEISLSGAFALYPLAVRWADEFKKIHPNVRIDISAGGAGKGITDVLNNMVDIGMVSRDLNPFEIKKGAIGIAVTKDAVVPVISAKNPFAKELLAKGIKKDAAINIWVTEKYSTWGQIANTKNNTTLNVYTRSDACGAAEVWAKYLGKKQEDLAGNGVYGDPGLSMAVKNDPYGIGYNNMAYAYDYKSKKQLPGIFVLPIDLNSNGKIDPNENFYNSMDQLIDAITAGKYPSPPARDLLFVIKGNITNPAAKEFIRWVLNEGQKFVRESGYINLSKEKITGELKKVK